jgi:hypothetical protein
MPDRLSVDFARQTYQRLMHRDASQRA